MPDASIASLILLTISSAALFLDKASVEAPLKMFFSSVVSFDQSTLISLPSILIVSSANTVPLAIPENALSIPDAAVTLPVVNLATIDPVVVS
ncbi:hypothetical protein D3C73_1378250 [compost metagenome]